MHDASGTHTSGSVLARIQDISDTLMGSRTTPDRLRSGGSLSNDGRS